MTRAAHSTPVKPPRIPLWEEVPEDRHLMVINPGDFPIRRTLGGLGILHSPLTDTFSIADADELRGRQDIVRYLMCNPALMQWLASELFESELPRHESAWLQYYSTTRPHNPFWNQVHELIERLDTDTLPPRLRRLREALQARLGQEEQERAWADQIGEALEQTTVMEGLLVFRVSMRHVAVDASKHDVTKSPDTYRVCDLKYLKETERHWPISLMHGHTRFSRGLAELGNVEYPDWTGKWFWRITGIGRAVRRLVDRAHEAQKQQAYEGMVIHEASAEVVEDVRAHLLQKFGGLVWETTALENATVYAYVTYSDAGLEVRVVSVEARESRPEEVQFKYNDFPGYSQDRMREIARNREDINCRIREGERGVRSDQIRAVIVHQFPEFFSCTLKAASPRTDRQHRAYALPNLIEGPQFKAQTDQVRQNRQFVCSHLGRLQDVVCLILTLQRVAKDHGLPLELPEFIDDGHIVEFERLYPVHLLPALGEKQRLHPVNLPALNGRMIALTGDHGGGKTVTELAIAELIWLAQSGLPVFGRNVRLNMKRYLALVFIEQGIKGSVAQLLIRKLANVLRDIQDVDGREVVVVLDELGSATQELDGFETGRLFLRKLQELGVSVIFSTQITRLAEAARSEFHALCFQVDRRTYRLSEGIGDGGMADLRRESGFDRLLR